MSLHQLNECLLYEFIPDNFSLIPEVFSSQNSAKNAPKLIRVWVYG